MADAKPSLALLGQLVARASFLPTLAWNLAMERVSSRRWWDRIDSTVILGAIPFRSAYTRHLVQAEGVAAVVALNVLYELRLCSPRLVGWAGLGVRFLHLPTTDLVTAPSQARLQEGVGFIRAARPGETVYVHCKAGRARSATLVGCYLMETTGCSPEEAVARLRAARPHILLQAHHRQALAEYHAAMLARAD
jgi:atypical dual specificity phosphatase